MVSVLLIIIETIRPVVESGPYVLNTSSVRPVAAELENILTKATENMSGDMSNIVDSGVKHDAQSANAPECLKKLMARNKPTRVGRISSTVLKPSSTPSINVL